MCIPGGEALLNSVPEIKYPLMAALAVFGYITVFQSEAGLQWQHDMGELRDTLEKLGFPMKDFHCGSGPKPKTIETVYDFLAQSGLLIRAGGYKSCTCD